MRNGDYVQGQQQARKLPNPVDREVVTTNKRDQCIPRKGNWVYNENENNNKSLIEQQLEGKLWCQQPR